MTLTRIWGSLLVLMTSAFLAGMFMLAAGGETGFSEGEKKAVEAVTNAGTAALTAELESSPVGLGPSLLKDANLAEHLRATAAGEELAEDAPNLQTLLFDVANDPLGLTNLADDPASQGTLRAMQQALRAWRAATSDPWLVCNPALPAHARASASLPDHTDAGFERWAATHSEECAF